MQFKFKTLRLSDENIYTIELKRISKSPLKKDHVYDVDCFGTRTLFKPNIFVVVKQNVKTLLASNNPTAMAFLAAKYAAQSKNDMKKRLKLKKKIFDLMEKRGFTWKDNQNIINFVFDYMLLPQRMEEEIKLHTPYFQTVKKTQGMIMTPNKAFVMDVICVNETGMHFIDYANSKNEEIAVEKAAKEAAKAEAEAAKEAAKENDIKTIHAMLKADFSIERIADILGFDLNYAKELAELKPKSA